MKRNIFSFLFTNSRGYIFNFFVAVIASIIITVCEIARVDIISKLVDSVSIGLGKGNIFLLLCIMLTVIITGIFFKYILRMNTSCYSLGLTYNIRKKIIYRISHAKISSLNELHSGDIIGILNSNLGMIESFISETLMSYVSIPLTLILSIAFLAFVNWQLMIASFISTPVAAIVVHFITKPIGSYAQKYYDMLGKENGLVSDTVEGLITIKAYGAHSGLLERYKDFINLSKKYGLKMDFRNIVVLPIVIIMNELPYIICAIYGGYLAVNGKITPGGLVAFLQLLRKMIGPTTQIMGLISSYHSVTGASKQLLELMNVPEEHGGHILNFQNKQESYLEFENVKFGYSKETPVLEKVSFKICAREKIAFVGESGAGKSTIVDLICRFYEPQHGKVLFWGQNAEKLSADSIRECISVVSQNSYIFTGTIEDNIRCGYQNATHDEIVEAAKRAQIHTYIESLSEQYGTIIRDNGDMMSGGQKQRLAIARALLRKSQILILDEPTSALDYQSEKLILDEIYNLFIESIIIIVTHRFSTIRYCDRIFVVNNGNIVESGRIKELMKMKGYFYKLYEEQMLEGNEA